jgi:hypothetical protein
MSGISQKEKIVKAVSELPSDAGFEEAMEKLYLLYKIERGIQQADSNQMLSDSEAKKKLQKWLE